MKDLEDRKKQRSESRGLQQRGVDPMTAYGIDGQRLKVSAADKSNGSPEGGDSTDPLDSLTIPQLRDWVKAQDAQNPVEVPAEIKLKDDVLAYAKNYRASLEAAKANGGW